jgi:hypothetical protein
MTVKAKPAIKPSIVNEPAPAARMTIYAPLLPAVLAHLEEVAIEPPALTTVKPLAPVPRATPIFTVPKLAKYTLSSPNTIYGLINSGQLAAFCLNPESPTRKNWRVRLSDWEAFVNKQKSSRTELA